MKQKFLPLVLSLMLGGCFVVGPDYAKPKVDVPQKWRMATDQVKDTADVQWWKQMNDPVLNRLIDRALEGNYDLQIAIANIDKYSGLYGVTRSNLFPQLFGSAGYDRNQASGLEKGFDQKIPDTDHARLGANISWEIDIWGQLRRAKEASYADLMAQNYASKAIILTLVSLVAENYINLRALDWNLQVTRQTVDSLREEYRIAKSRFDMGYSSEIEVIQSLSELERRNALIPQFEQRIAETEHALSVLIGVNPGAIERGHALDEFKLPAIPAGLPSELLLRRPDIQQQEQNLISANARIGVARGEYFPKLQLTGDVGQASLELAQLMTPGANFWTIGVKLLGPIFTAGKIAGQVQAAEASQRAALANYQQTIITAFREFEDALVSNSKTLEKQQAEARRVEAASEYLRISRVRYDEGYTPYLEVLDALRQYYEAQIELIQARNQNFLSYVKLYKAMGGGWLYHEKNIRLIQDITH